MFVFNVCVYVLAFIVLVHSVPKKKESYVELKSCDNSANAAEVASYGSVVQNIVDYVRTGPFKGKVYKELAKFVDTFGARPSGSEVLEKSIDYMIQLARNEDLNDIITEGLEVPRWVRGEENITMFEPRVKNIALLGLGRSV